MIIWNLFEQSGTFKKVLQEKNYTSYDVDIVKTENVDFNIDLFKEITNYYQGIDLDNNLFSRINTNDIVFSFFPCIHFENQANLQVLAHNYPDIYKSDLERIKKSQERERERSMFYEIFCKMYMILLKIGCKAVIENPYSTQHYLNRYFPVKSSLIIEDRTQLGDIYKKPTQFWFINFEPKNLLVSKYVKDKNYIRISDTHGIKKSYITSTFAKIFIEEYVGL